MTQSEQKFTFGKSFDTVGKAEPAITKEQLQTEKEQAFAQGKQAAEQGLLAKGLQTTSQLITLLDKALQEQQQLLAQVNSASLALCRAMLHKIYPHSQAKFGLQEMETIIASALQELSSGNKIILYTASAQKDTIAQWLEQEPRFKQIVSHVDLRADDALAPHDVRMEWGIGGLERIGNDVLSRLDTLLNQAQPAHSMAEGDPR